VITPVERSDWRELSSVLASAFFEDPVFSWLLPNTRTRARALQRFFGIETRDIVLSHRRSIAAREGEQVAGTALVLPEGHWRTPFRVQALQAGTYARIFGRRLPRALGVLLSMERRHVRESHLYLPYIGVLPDAQGAGIGTALLRPLLDECDQHALPAYLEASNPRCARLYRRLGFETIDRIEPFGSPPIELMLRPPPA
jgi:ribosomal protein S18 acetylase RimI-like enzyme